MFASHRADTQAFLGWVGPDGVIFEFVNGNRNTATDKFANDPNLFKRSGVVTVHAPLRAVAARLLMRKNDTYEGQGDSYAWFWRPYIGAAREGQNSWNDWSPGNARVVQVASDARVESKFTTLADADRAIGQRIDSVVADYQGRDANTNARVDGQATALADAKQALGQRIDTVDASIGSAVDAKAQDITTAYTTADQALGSRTSTLEASATGGSSNVKNDRFALWPDGQTYPTAWTVWQGGGNYRVERTIAEMGSPYCVRALNDSPDVESGFYQTIASLPGKWVVEVTAQNSGGNLQGAGVTLSGIYNLDFASEPDTNGYVGDRTDYTPPRTWVKVFDVGDHGTLNVHAMQGWRGFNRGISPKYMKWYRLSVRPAGPGDIAGVKNAVDVTAVSARVANTENTLADLPNRYAAAARTATIEAQLAYQQASGLSNAIGAVDGRVTDTTNALVARIEDRATAIADAKAGAVAQTVSQLRAEYNGTSATVSQQAGAIVNLQGKATAYVRLVADAGGGRAALSLWSDQYGGAWSLQGNGLIDGDLTLTGSLNTGKLAPNAVTASAALKAQNAQVNANAEVGSASATIITSSSSAVRIEYKCLASYYASQGGASAGCYGTVVRIANGVETAVLAVRFGSNTFTNDWAYDFPPEGQVTYVLRFRDYIATGSGGYYWSVSQIQLGILGFKR